MNGRTVASVALTVVLLAVFLLAFRPAALLRELHGADVGVLLLGVLAVVAALCCWTSALWFALRVFAPVSWRRLFLAYNVGTLGKLVLPMGRPGGPALMAYAVHREADLEYERSLAVVTVVDFLGVVASVVLASLGVASLLVRDPSIPHVRALGGGVLAFSVLLLGVAVVVVSRRTLVERSVHGVARLLNRLLGRRVPRLGRSLSAERVGSGLRRYYETFDTLGRERRTLAAAFALGLLGQLCFSSALYASAHALGVQLSLPLAVFAVLVGSVAVPLPLPGGLGAVEFVLVGLVVTLAGVDPAAAAATVVLYRLCSYWFRVALGALASVYSVVGVRELPTDIEKAA